MKSNMKLSSSFLLYVMTGISIVYAVDINGSALRGNQDDTATHRALIDATAIPEGQAIVCYSDEQKVHRWSDGELHWYPNYLVASSWDEHWRSYMEVNCEALSLPMGDPMQQKITLPDEGSIMCFHDESVIFYWNTSKGLLRKYPNPKIASLWHKYWYRDFVLVDCDGLGLGYGADLTAGVPEDGSIVTCREDEEKVYLVDDGALRWFPNPKIASSWKVYWRPHMMHVDCKFLPFGENMPMKLTIGVPEDGSIVTCYDNEERVYLMENGVLRWFPNPKIASSWDAFWRQKMMHADCDPIRFGEDMTMKEG